LQWTDLGDHGVGDPSGAGITWGNGTVFNGNSFNERPTDVSNYNYVQFRVMVTDPLDGGGTVGMQPFFQTTGSYTYQAPGYSNVPIDGTYHTFTYPLAGLTNLEETAWTGLNLAAHTNDLVIDVDYVLFSTVPEPSTITLLGIACAACLGAVRRTRKKR
jgi:hypothetical protein